MEKGEDGKVIGTIWDGGEKVGVSWRGKRGSVRGMWWLRDDREEEKRAEKWKGKKNEEELRWKREKRWMMKGVEGKMDEK